MAWHRPGDKPLSEPMIVYQYRYASLSLCELIIGSGKGMFPFLHQAITWTNTDLLSVGLLGTYFSEIQNVCMNYASENVVDIILAIFMYWKYHGNCFQSKSVAMKKVVFYHHWN